jgi:arylsulfatase A-like enzyme
MLREQGANSLEARTITHSYTLPSHTSMLTGVDTDRHGMLHNNFTPSRGFIRVPPIFYYAHDAGLTTAMFVSKPKLRHIAIPGSVDVFSRPDYLCGPVVAAAAEHLSHAGAGLTFVHLSEPDEFGHSRGWMTEAYLRGVASADHCIGTLLTTIAARPDLDRFLMLISADHGGHGRTHGSERDEDMRIPWIAWGSRVTRGAFSSPVSTMDTAATALAALGLPVPAEFTGRAVRIALENAAAGSAPSVPAVPDSAAVSAPVAVDHPSNPAQPVAAVEAPR